VSGVSPRGWGLVRLPDSDSSSNSAADEDPQYDPYPVGWSVRDPYSSAPLGSTGPSGPLSGDPYSSLSSGSAGDPYTVASSASDPYSSSAGRGYDVDGYRLAASPDFSTPTPRSFREALRPFEFPAPYIEDQLESVDRRLGAQDMQMLELREKFEATERQLAEATKKLDDFQKGDWISSKMPRFTDGFRFTGAYLRTGYGINGRGGGIEEFTAPDGLFNINFRLGNEKDTYGEMGFEKSFNYEDDKKPQYMVRSMFAYKFLTDKTNYTTDQFSDLLIRETYVRASNVIQGEKDTAFWAGQRFYDRADIHINDLFALDNSGWGGGVENINLGYGKLWVAALGGTRDGYRQYNGRGTLTELHLDFRLKEVKALEGTSMFWLDIAYVPGGSFQAFDPQSVFASNVGDQHLSGNIDMINYSKSDFDNELGFAVGIIHDRQLWGGANRTFLMHGIGAGADFNTYIVVGKPPGAVGDQDRWFFANWNVRQFNDSVSMMWMVLFDQDNVGRGDDGTYGYGFKQPVRRVYSAGARPYFMFSDHFGISGELGLDLVDEIRYTDKAGDGTFLQKATIAPVIKKGRGFWDRPELRVFATHAWWGNNAKGLVANPAYGDVLAGWNFGIQGEAWW
ncbi:MAG TPA: carbohydrate porin, partial [Pirellulaceae bacterium]|nr:carbohydrate porin [Pirellulaceae bacterium]